MAFNQIEMPFYTFDEYTPQVALRLEYAHFEVSNPTDWTDIAAKAVPYEIDLVFTKYPADLEDWRTDYFDLLNDRLRTLSLVDSALLEGKIKWNLILQTQASDEESAKKLFHGFVIKYRPKRLRYIEEVRNGQQLRMLISGKATSRDSTVFKVLERHPEWDNMLVVMDWTGSMYKHGAQLVLWHKYNAILNESRVRHFVFFNDGNHKQTWQKKSGKTGGVYRARNGEMDELVSTMEYVMKKGNGGDAAENDLEALLTGLQYLEAFEEVILIADNKSEIRDMDLLEKINRPVRIILCDVKGEVHPHYQQLAETTGGSIHTIKADLEAAPLRAARD